MKSRLESKYYAVTVIRKSVGEGNRLVALEGLRRILDQYQETQESERFPELKQVARELNVLLYYKAQQYKVNFLKSHEIYRQMEQRLDRCASGEAVRDLLEKMVCGYADLIRTDARRQYSNLIRNCLDHIDQNFTESVTAESEAARLNVSRSYLSHRFVQETGCRLTDYVNNLRIRYACTLLEDLQFPIQRVAEATGFSTANYFARTFRERMGMSPRAYREARQKGKGSVKKEIDPGISIK